MISVILISLLLFFIMKEKIRTKITQCRIILCYSRLNIFYEKEFL